MNQFQARERIDRPSADRCPLCGDAAPEPFVDLGSVPANCSSFKASATEARRIPTGSIRLALCTECGYIYNIDYDATVIDYDDTYDNCLSCSPRFQTFEAELVDELIERWNLRAARVLEVGCGQGEFLARLCRRSDSMGVGYDPSWAGRPADDRVRIIASTYDPGTTRESADLVCCRHLIEHLEDPLTFAARLTRTLQPGTGLYIEVPNAGHLLGTDDLWDLIYPHRSYFVAASLERLARDAGIDVIGTTATFEEQFLSLHGRVGREPSVPPHDERLGPLAEAVRTFAGRLAERIGAAATLLADLRAAGQTGALWGAGARGVTFLNVVPGASEIELVVDINPRKTGLHVPGTGQVVVGPDEPGVRRAHTIVVMNPVYMAEIAGRLGQAGRSPRLVAA